MTSNAITTFYGAVNDGAFWHWPTLLHFCLVALAGGVALLVAYRALGRERLGWRLPALSVGLIALDMVVLWAESLARWRLTHVYLFLSIRPASAIWWGAWGLAGSAVLGLLLAFGWGPRRLWGALLVVTSTMALLYPGLALAANSARPLWTPLLLAFMPVTGLLLAWGLALLFRQTDLRPAVAVLGLAGALLGGLYLVGLATGGLAAREGLAHLWHEGGTLFVAALAAMLLGPALLRRYPALAGVLVVAGAILARTLLVEIGAFMPPLS